MDSADRTLHQESFVNSADLLEGLLRVSQIVRLRFNEWLERFDLNEGRLAVLTALSQAHDAGCSQAELAEHLSQSESNVSTLIERMARDALVSRHRSDADRRKRILQMTSAGRERLASVESNRSAWASRLFRGMTASEQPMLFDLLQRLGHSLEASVGIAPVQRESNPVPEVVSLKSNVHRDDRTDDPKSPQYALRQMLLALSASAGIESAGESGDLKDAA